MRSYDDRNDGGLFFGAVAIVALGSLLGIGQNVMIRKGEDALQKKEIQRRSLSWIKREQAIAVMDEPKSAPVAMVASDNPFRMADSTDSSLPELPDVAQPVQMQLTVIKKFFDAGAAVFVDARPKEEYDAGHIPGAVHLSYDEAAFDPARLESFDPQGKPIIVYCGGGTCELSKNLAWALINADKKKVFVFIGGTPEWEAAGYPLDRVAEAK